MHTKILPPQKFELVDLPELWRYRSLFATLALRDIKLRYRQTFLGVSWVVIQPLFNSAVFALIFGRFGNLPSDNVPYELFAFVALLPWNLISQAITRASSSLVRDMRMVTRVFFPRIIIPVSSTVSALLDFVVGLVVLFIVLLIYRMPLTWRILIIPLLVLVSWGLAVNVGLLISALNVYYRDFQYTISFVLQAWMYVSPVAYAASIIPTGYRLIYSLNPVVGIIEAFRWAFLGTEKFPGFELSLTLIILVLLSPISLIGFQRIEKYFADVI